MLLSTIAISTITKNRIQISLPWFVLSLILIVSFVIRSRYLWMRAMIYDEGHWLMFAVLSNAGYTPYTTTFVGIPPLALLTIQLGAKLFDVTLGVRYPMMLFSLLGITSLFCAFQPRKSIFNLVTGLLAAIFFSFDLESFRGSGTFMGEVPAVSMAILSFVLAQQYHQERRLFWLMLSGLAFGLSLALKLFVVFFPALMGLVILLTIIQGMEGFKISVIGRLIVAGLTWLSGVIIPWAIFMMFYDPQAMYQEIFLFRLAYRDVNLSQSAIIVENSLGVIQMMVDRLPLVIGAIVGSIIGWRERRSDVWLWLAWLILAIGPLVWQSPLRYRYSVILLPPLAALSGITVTYLAYWLFQWLQSKRVDRISELAIVSLLAGIIILAFAVPVKSLSRPPDPYTFPDLNFDIVEYIKQTTVENDCIVTDDQRFAFASNRLVPAALSETAQGRLATGWLTTEDIVREIEQHECAAVVYMVDYFKTYLPDLSSKLRDLYFLEITYDENFIVYSVKKQITSQPAISLEAEFGRTIALKGIDLASSPWQPGQEIHLGTYWMALQPPEQAYKIFVQLRNDRNETVATFDYFPFAAPNNRYRLLPEFEYQYRIVPHLTTQMVSAEDIAIYPAKGMLPMNAWPVGRVIREVKTIRLPMLTPGNYDLYLGLYDPDTLSRLPVSESGEGDTLWLAQIEVTEKK